MEIVGRLTADAVVKTTKQGKKVVDFSLAVNERYKGADGTVTSLATYFNCSYWQHAGIAAHLTKGSLVELHGRVSVNAWNDAAGKAKANLNFHVNSIKLHGKTIQPATAEAAPLAASSNDDLPF